MQGIINAIAYTTQVFSNHKKAGGVRGYMAMGADSRSTLIGVRSTMHLIDSIKGL